MPDKTDISDAFKCLAQTGMTTRCPGGRLILDGYICMHCGKDPTEGKCGAPKRKLTDHETPLLETRHK